MIIASRLLQDVTNAAAASYPDEACGLLIGTGDVTGIAVVTGIEPAANVAAGTRRDRFEVDPRVRFAVMRRLRNRPERVIGHYHSHPDHPAVPSCRDLQMAFEPDLIWLITSVAAGQVMETGAFIVDTAAGGFRRVALEVVTSDEKPSGLP